MIRGKVKFNKQDIKDFVIARGDGSALFYLTGVVDDNAMRISHVIRGEEHLSNTPKQILLQVALGYPSPIYAHLPLILNTDRSKMSKRHNPVSLTRDFQNQGYLPQALVSFLALLGWYPTNTQLKKSCPSQAQDIFAKEELVAIYDIHRVQKGGAIFQIQKLQRINQYYISLLNSQQLLNAVLPFAQFAKADVGKIARSAWVVKEHLKTLADFPRLARFFFQLPEYSARDLIFHKSTKEKTRLALQKVAEIFQTLPLKATPEEIKRRLMAVVSQKLSVGDVFYPTRVALSGLQSSPPPEQIAWVLGNAKSKARVRLAIKKLLSDVGGN